MSDPSGMPPPKSAKQAKAERLQAALRDNLRRRKQADQATSVPVHENGTSQQPQN